jgi:hypothetical protein
LKEQLARLGAIQSEIDDANRACLDAKLAYEDRAFDFSDKDAHKELKKAWEDASFKVHSLRDERDHLRVCLASSHDAVLREHIEVVREHIVRVEAMFAFQNEMMERIAVALEKRAG